MIITINDSAMSKLNTEERDKKALEIAKLAFESYEGTHKTIILIVTSNPESKSASIITYPFSIEKGEIVSFRKRTNEAI